MMANPRAIIHAGGCSVVASAARSLMADPFYPMHDFDRNASLRARGLRETPTNRERFVGWVEQREAHRNPVEAVSNVGGRPDLRCCNGVPVGLAPLDPPYSTKAAGLPRSGFLSTSRRGQRRRWARAR